MATGHERLLLFGASGAIGSSIMEMALGRGWEVTAVGRKAPDTKDSAHSKARWIVADPLAAGFDKEHLRGEQPYASVCWAQGTNCNDSVYDMDAARHQEVYDANCTYILVTLQALLTGGMLEQGSRLCVISSIWQEMARQNKLSYCMSKAALRGLVLSAAADLAKDGHCINAVLPGALDTPMTRKNLTAEQMQRIEGGTLFGALPKLEDVARTVCHLCSHESTGVTGQFIAVDLGYSNVRII